MERGVLSPLYREESGRDRTSTIVNKKLKKVTPVNGSWRVYLQLGEGGNCARFIQTLQN